MQKPKKILLNKYFILLATCFFVNKMIFNESGSPQGGFNTNVSLYLNAAATVFFALIAFLTQKRLLNIVGYTPYLLVYIFYFFSLFTTLYSGIKVLTLYNALLGLLFILFSQALLKSIVFISNTGAELFRHFNKLVLTLAITMIGTTTLFELVFLKNYEFYRTGIGADFSVLLLLYFFISKFLFRKTIFNLLFMLLALVFSTKLNSFSSYLSVLVGLLVYLLLTGRFLIFSLFTSVSITLVFSATMFLTNNLDLVINNKPAAAYMSGSGRFAYYIEAINVITNEFSNSELFFGRGFMAERVYMEGRGLFWVTDPHSSALTSFLGLGGIGLLLYLTFILHPFLYYHSKKNLIVNSCSLKEIQLLLVFHSIASAYGMTSSYYLGRPSFLLILGLVALGSMLTMIKYHEKK